MKARRDAALSDMSLTLATAGIVVENLESCMALLSHKHDVHFQGGMVQHAVLGHFAVCQVRVACATRARARRTVVTPLLCLACRAPMGWRWKLWMAALCPPCSLCLCCVLPCMAPRKAQPQMHPYLAVMWSLWQQQQQRQRWYGMCGWHFSHLRAVSQHLVVV